MAGLTASIKLLGDTSGDAVTAAPVITDVSVSDTVGITPGLEFIRAVPVTMAETAGLAGTVIGSYGQVIAEHLAITLSQSTTGAYHISASDAVSLVEQLFPGIPQTVTETIAIAATQQVQMATTIIEQLNLQPTLTPLFHYYKAINESVQLADTLATFFGASLAEGIGIGSTLTPIGAFAGAVSEGIGLSGTITPQWILHATISDSLVLDDNNILNMIYKPVVTEGIQISAAYIAPDGSITTWAMNTRSGAVTEYDNYAFNSFAKLDDTYLGATDAGLYELLGDDDDGTDIVATIKSGFSQWAGSRFMMFKGIYLGVRGEGDFVLKLITGDDKTFVYGVSPRNQRTTKVHHGKGLRARYWAFELISTGQDFDLDTIEFVPLVADRRV